MNIFSNFGSQLFRGSVSSTNSASYINKQNVNVLLDPSGTDYIDYSNNNSYFNDAHGININDENTTSLLLNNSQTLNPFSLSSLDEFTIYMKYKVHDVSNLPILGQIYTNPNYEISFSNISPSIGDTFTVSVLNGSNTNVTYTISGDITSADLSYADMYGVLTDIENNLTYTLNSGLGKFIFTIDNTDISASFNVLKTYFVIVQNNVLGEPVFSFSETGEVGPYYNQPDLSFGAGSKNLFDVSDPTMADISFVFGTVVDNSSTIIDSFVTYQDGVVILDICSGYVGESLKYFEDTTAGMGYNLLNVTTQIGGDQWSQMGSAIDKTTPLRVSGSNSKLITVDEFVYEYNGSSWNQKGSLPLTLPNGPSTRTMCSISDDGSIILCAYDSNANANYQEEIESFTWNGSNWVLHGVVPISNSGTTTIRSDVKISGNGQVAVLGYWRYDLIEIYSWDGSTWILDLSYADTTTNSIEGGSLGWKVDCSEDGSVVLASGIGGPALFVKNNGTYSLQQQTGFPTSASYGEGSISADGTHVIFLYVTAWNVAYHYKVFAYDGSTWSQKGSNISSNYNVERSGFEDHNATAFINKDGSQVTTSNVNYSPNGMCYNTTYTFDGTSWIQTTSVTIQSVWSYGRTSQHVSSDGRLLVIGDRGYADKVYVYDIPKSEFNYTVTVSGDSSVFYLDDGINGVIAQPDLQFESGTLYKFDQSDPTNAGNTLVLGTVYDSSTNIIDYQTIVGTPGQPGAYTSFTASGETVYYYSFETPNMGLPPPNITDDLYVHYDFEFPLYDPTGTERTDGLTGGNDNVRTYNKAYDSSTNSDVSYNGYLSKFGNGSAHLDSTIKKIGNSSLKVNESPVRSENAWKLNNDQGYSICFWMKEDSANGPLFGMDNLNGAPFFVIEYNSSTLTVNNNGTTLTYNISALTMTKWNHIAFTISPDSSDITWKLYINGSLVNTKTYGNYLVPQNIRSDYPDDLIFLVDIGARPGLSQYKGYFDDFRFYKTELSSAQVYAVYTYSG